MKSNWIMLITGVMALGLGGCSIEQNKPVRITMRNGNVFLLNATRCSVSIAYYVPVVYCQERNIKAFENFRAPLNEVKAIDWETK